MGVRDWRGERDWWLDHFWQAPVQSDANGVIKFADLLAVPRPTNSAAPLGGDCLLWRGPLSSEGYGIIGGQRAHRIAYMQVRGSASIPGHSSILHMCNRRSCVQPSHLYAGTAQDNAEDREAAVSEMHTYRTWSRIGRAWDVAFASAEFGIEVPPSSGGLVHSFFPSPRECPHSFGIPARDDLLCRNCMERDKDGHRTECRMPRETNPCRCLVDPCNCKMCLMVLLGPAQKAVEWRHGIDGPLFNEIPARVLDLCGTRLTREEGKYFRWMMETASRTGNA